MSKRTGVKPATLTDVARLAGVSIPTASRVLNGGVRGKESGSAELRERVKDAARRLGYAPSPAAQTIKGGRSKTVAVLISDIEDYGSATIVAGIMHAAEERGLSVAVRATHDDSIRERDLLTALRAERHHGVILATSRTTDVERERALQAELELLRQHGTAVVMIGDSALPFPSVTVDNRAAAVSLARALADGGASRFAVLDGPREEITARDRVEGFLSGLAAAGVADIDRVEVEEFSRDGGYRAAGRLPRPATDYDVVSAMSDAMAVGVIARLREDGVSVPHDVEVTGFDHVPLIGDLLPDFSTVEIPLEEFGEAALSLVFSTGEAIAGISLRATPVVKGVRLSS